MREIKFRAWDKKEKKMKNENDFLMSLDGEILDPSTFPFMVNKNCLLMQYTGLTDKNGNKIYEMDIVNYFGKKILVTIPEIYIEIYESLFLEYCEVIGNKFENPKLLDDKK